MTPEQIEKSGMRIFKRQRNYNPKENPFKQSAQDVMSMDNTDLRNESERIDKKISKLSRFQRDLVKARLS